MLSRYETAASSNLNHAISQQLLTNAASHNDPMNPSLLSICFMQYSTEMPNATARVSVGYGWVQLLWVRGWAKAYSCTAWQGTRPVLWLYAAWASVNTDTSTSRQYFKQVHDRSPVLHTTTEHDRAVTDRASIANCVGKISRLQTLQNVYNCHKSGVLQKCSPTKWTVQCTMSSAVCPLSVVNIHQVDIMMYSTMANSPPSTSLLMSSLDTHPTTSWMTISSNTTLVHTDHYILQALPPHGSSQNDHIPTDVI